MKPLAAATIVLLLVWDLSAGSGSGRVQRPAPDPVTIPIELAGPYILVKASVNKSRPLFFLLDTGATAAIVRLAVAKELGLSLTGTVNARGAGAGSQTGSQVRNARWSLAGLEPFSQPLTLALPLPELPSALGRDVDGIIGGEFVRQFVLELDYEARSIRLHTPAAFEYRGGGETLPLDFNPNGHPVVKATVTPLSGPPLEHRFMLDTGSGLALALHSPFVEAHGLLASQAKTIRAIGGAGAGGRSAGRLGRVASLQIGRFTIENPITLFSEDSAGAFADAALAGNLGAQIAKRFRMFLDYGRRRLTLEPSSAFAEPFDRAFSGVALRAEGADYRTFRVREVLGDSPASEAGILAGDIVTAIGGTAAATLTLPAINEMLEKPVTRQLVIRRGDQMLTVALTPRPLI